jgi:GT2 family glycosyltransferase
MNGKAPVIDEAGDTIAPHVSVIVLNYNGLKWLSACLNALVGQVDAPAFEIVLVDNGSTDGSSAYVESRYPSVRIVQTGRNLGYAGGNNAGARHARGAWLAFLNNDTVAAPDWLARLDQAAGAREGAPLVTSRLESLAFPGYIDSAGDGYLRAGGAYKRGHGTPIGEWLQSREVFGACGAGFLIRRDVFDQLAGFDEDFFMVYEDVDLSYRARLAGHRCWYAAEAIVRHAGSATLGTVSAQAVYYGQRNLEWTWLKNAPAGLLLRTLPEHLVYSLAGVAHYIASGRGGAAIRGKLDALVGVPRLLRKRRAVQRARRISVASLEVYLDRGWIALKRSEKARRREAG